MKNPSRHQKVSRSRRRQWNLYRSRRKCRPEDCAWNWIVTSTPITRRHITRRHRRRHALRTKWADAAGGEYGYHYEDIRDRQHYGVIWDKERTRLRRLSLQQAQNYLKFLKTYGYVGSGIHLASALTGAAAAAASAAQSYQRMATAIGKVVSGTVRGVGSMKTVFLPAGGTSFHLFDDSDEDADSRRARIAQEQRDDLSSTPDAAGYVFGYRVWGVKTQLVIDDVGLTWNPPGSVDDYDRRILIDHLLLTGAARVGTYLSSYGIGDHQWKRREEAFCWGYSELLGNECANYRGTRVPSFYCQCGIWAQYHWLHLPVEPSVSRAIFDDDSVIAGLVRGGGKVVESERGWRSEWAEVVELYCNGWCEWSWGGKVEKLAREYGVPVKRVEPTEIWFDREISMGAERVCSHPTTPLQNFKPADLD